MILLFLVDALYRKWLDILVVKHIKVVDAPSYEGYIPHTFKKVPFYGK